MTPMQAGDRSAPQQIKWACHSFPDRKVQRRVASGCPQQLRCQELGRLSLRCLSLGRSQMAVAVPCLAPRPHITLPVRCHHLDSESVICRPSCGTFRMESHWHRGTALPAPSFTRLASSAQHLPGSDELSSRQLKTLPKMHKSSGHTFERRGQLEPRASTSKRSQLHVLA